MARERQQKKDPTTASKRNPFEWIGVERGGEIHWMRPLPATYELPPGISLHPGGSISADASPTYFCIGISQKPGFLSSARNASLARPRGAYQPPALPPGLVTEYSEWVRFAGRFDWAEIQRRLDRYHPQGWEDKPYLCVAVRLCRWEEVPYHHLLLPKRFLKPNSKQRPESIPECMKEYFLYILESARREQNSKLMDTAEYFRILQDLGLLTQRVIGGKKIGLDDLQTLNEINVGLAKNPTHIHDFLAEFWDSLAQELCRNRIAGRCLHCGALMSFRSNKRYCTVKQENRDCGKAARNRRYQARLKKPS